MIGVLARCIGRTERSASKLLLLPNTSSTSNLRSCQHRAHTRTSRISRRSQCRESLPKQGLPFVRDHGFASAHQERMQVGDTIYALATASGRAAIAIVRVSGPGCSEIYSALCPETPLPRPRRVSVRTLYDPLQNPNPNSVLDSGAVVLFFEGPKSSTGEDVLELHVHGGPAIVSATLKAVSDCPLRRGKVRYAEPGEFTRRAFFNNRLDLTQVEALGDVLSAATEQQRRLSIRGTTSRLAHLYEDWRFRLLHARGELEALIDFSEDQHFEESHSGLIVSVLGQVTSLQERIAEHLDNAMRGELLRNGIRVALLGAPNAGKSSLLNRIVGRDAAIVSHEAGTTRDIVEVGIDLGGYLCRFDDMAGLRAQGRLMDSRETVSAIEIEGIRRAKERALEADVVIVVLELAIDGKGAVVLRLDPEVLESAAHCSEKGVRMLAVINKVDLLRSAPSISSDRLVNDLMEQLAFLKCGSIFPISCLLHSGYGLADLKDGLVASFVEMTSMPPQQDGDGSKEALGLSERHRSLLTACRNQLQKFAEHAESDIVLAAESLRESADCLARITGRGETSDVEEVLGVIFERFCVGK